MQTCSCVAKVIDVSQLEVIFCSRPTFYEGNHVLLNDFPFIQAQGEANERALRLSDLPLLGVPSAVNGVILKFETRE